MAGRPRNPASATAILAAAIALLRERGYEGLTLDEVARVAGVGKSSLYSRFRTRAELAAAALASLQRELPPSSGELRTDLMASLRAAERNLSHVGPGVLGAVLGSGSSDGRPHGRLIVGPAASRLGRLLELGRARGVVAQRADLQAALELLVGALLARVLLTDEVGAPWPERVVDAILAGLAP
jgi:AcrR family transcriptional regulator